jgi:hypothetical protein
MNGYKVFNNLDDTIIANKNVFVNRKMKKSEKNIYA